MLRLGEFYMGQGCERVIFPRTAMGRQPADMVKSFRLQDLINSQTVEMDSRIT